MAEERWLGWLRREWRDVAVPPFEADPNDEGLRAQLDELRAIYREQSPRVVLRIHGLRAPADGSRRIVVMLACAAAVTFAAFVRAPWAPAAPPARPERTPRAEIVRADARKTEILLGRVRFVFVNERHGGHHHTRPETER